MNVIIKSSIRRDLKKIANPRVNSEVDRAVLSAVKAVKPKDIPELRKLEGGKKDIYYRIKIKRYRIGVTIVGDTVTFVRCLPRKDFFKHFPPK